MIELKSMVSNREVSMFADMATEAKAEPAYAKKAVAQDRCGCHAEIHL